jgi:hypothetical protein
MELVHVSDGEPNGPAVLVGGQITDEVVKARI